MTALTKKNSIICSEDDMFWFCVFGSPAANYHVYAARMTAVQK